jgi:hypothetical protein
MRARTLPHAPQAKSVDLIGRYSTVRFRACADALLNQAEQLAQT